MWPGSAAGKHRAGIRFHGINFYSRIFCFQILPGTGQSSARTYARNQNIDFAIGILPDLRAGGKLVVRRIGGVLKLLGNEGTGILFLKFKSFGNSPFHSVCACSQHDFRTVSRCKFTAFNTHGFRHGQNKFITSDRCHKCQTNTGVAAGWLNDQRPRFQQTALFGSLDHGKCDPVFDGTTWIEKFHLGDNFGMGGTKFIYPDQRSAADPFQNSVGNIHSNTSSQSLLFRLCI